MAQRFKTTDLVTGAERLQEALVESAGAGDAGKIPALSSSGQLHESLMPTGIGAEITTVPSSENLSAGQFVNFWDDTGTLKARLANADGARPAHGFVKAGVVSPGNATVYPLGDINPNRSTLTPGATYFLAKTAGGVTDDISGYVDTDLVQRLGVAVSSTTIVTERNVPAILTDA
jgi:hypothetical protein